MESYGDKYFENKNQKFRMYKFLYILMLIPSSLFAAMPRYVMIDEVWLYRY